MVELIVVICLIAIISAIVIVAIAGGEVINKSNDAIRVSDMQSLNRSVSAYQASVGTSLGSVNTVYISLPDSNANCSSYSLPTLPAGWSYACKPSSSYRNTNGTGWLPVNFSSSGSGISIPTLPVDPTNSVSGRSYYSYVTNGNGNWELNCSMKAQSNSTGFDSDKISVDGGDDPTKYEIGNDLTLAPWSFEFSAFPVVANNSGFPGWYKYSGTGTVSIGSDATSLNYLEANGYVWYGWQENIPFNPSSKYKISCKVRQVTDPTSGGKGIYCGWTGVAADGTNLLNATGVNTYSSQHYHAVSGSSLTAGAGWTTFTGYTKGWGSPNGSSSACTNPASPCTLYQDVRYIRPMFILNYNAGNGVADLDSIIITKL